jgi:ribosomal protein S18 acetylase RimI-like enzyme
VSIETQAPPVVLRPVAAADEPFLAALYASTRAEEMALAGWDTATQQAFLWQQFQAQQSHYQSYFPAGEHRIVLRDGRPIGRVYHERNEDRLHLLDIALLPEERGRGVGGALMDDFLAEARAAGLAVTLHVYRFDAQVRAWYQRLGFAIVGENGLYDLMEWRPDSAG